MFPTCALVLSLLVLGYVSADTKIIPVKTQLIKSILPRQGCKANADLGTSDLCCEGKNITCRVFGERKKGKKNKTCFCDSSCKTLGDCCTDYEEACPAVDCVLDDWGPYGECNTRCGWGVKERTRHVMRQPRNGGKACGKSSEKLVCYAYKCKVARTPEGGLSVLQETGKIIPATYGSWRKNRLYNPYKDIRSNLFNHYDSNEIITRPTYCAKYEVTSARKSCESPFFADWAPKMTVGQSVCVECQQLAMHRKLGVRCKGHGVYMRETRWNAVTVPGCHGEWKMTTRHEECSCKDEKDLSFILL